MLANCVIWATSLQLVAHICLTPALRDIPFAPHQTPAIGLCRMLVLRRHFLTWMKACLKGCNRADHPLPAQAAATTGTPARAATTTSKPMVRAFLFGIWLASGIMVSTRSLADDSSPTFPPYPDVWGREFKIPSGARPLDFDFFHSNKDIIVGMAYVSKTSSIKTVGRTFFNWTEVNYQDNDWEELRDQLLEPPFSFQISGERHIYSSCPEPPRCLPDMNWSCRFGIYYDNNDKPEIEKMLFISYTKPEVAKLHPDCESVYGPLPDYIVKVRSVPIFFNMLEDGTFLMDVENIVIRFDQKLESPYVTKHPRLTLVDAHEVDAFIDKWMKNSYNGFIDDGVVEFQKRLGQLVQDTEAKEQMK